MEDSIEALARYRFETSEEALEDARLMYRNGRYKNSLNRAYYAIFHSIRAVNALKGYDSSKHREKADYLDFYVASKADAKRQIDRADGFLHDIKTYLNSEEIL